MKTAVLRDNRDFQRLYRRGKKAVSGMFAVYCAKNPVCLARVGITTGKKLGGAVVRNRARRQVREIVRLSAERLLPGNDVVVVVRHGALVRAWADQRADLLRLFALVGALDGVEEAKR
jgi:ribonuclease P protein component